MGESVRLYKSVYIKGQGPYRRVLELAVLPRTFGTGRTRQTTRPASALEVQAANRARRMRGENKKEVPDFVLIPVTENQLLSLQNAILVLEDAPPDRLRHEAVIILYCAIM
ncbi:unnamed protein product [Ixodes pacificus]